MRPFRYERVDRTAVADDAVPLGRERPERGGRQFLAGGTTLIDLMKLDVMRPSVVVDINALESEPFGRIETDRNLIRLGALVRMAHAAEHPDVRYKCPMIAQSLRVAASQQIRNMASLGGNVLQRTRCPYFRDVSYPDCNKREPGSGCAARDGFNRMHAVLGVSKHCIASYSGDFGQALIALDAEVEIVGPRRDRLIPFAALHRRPGATPHIETTLQPGEMIGSFRIPIAPWMRRSLYLKIADRESYAFALVSIALALDLHNGKARRVRIALGGVATVPWRAMQAEVELEGKTMNAGTIEAAATAAFRGAHRREHNVFKVELGKRAIVRAFDQVMSMRI